MTESTPTVLHTGTRGTRVIGILALIGLAWMLVWALVISPPDEVQGENVRFFYLHVPAAFSAYIAFALTALSSAAYLFKKTRSLTWDRIAGCSAEIGVILTALLLLTGMIWGKMSWGVYWRWDARLTSSLLLFVMYVGYLALRGLDASPEVRAKRCAIVGLIAFLDVPLVHYSVSWWRTLHQKPTLEVQGAEMDGSMLFSFFIAMIAFVLTFTWMMIHRHRIAMMEQAGEDHGLQRAIEQRHAETGANA